MKKSLLFEKVLQEHDDDINERAGVILIQKSSGKYLGCHAWGKMINGPTGWLDLPKGHLEKGDEPEEAAIRECREETGIVLKKSDLTKIDTYDYGKYPFHLFTAMADFDIENLHCNCKFESPFDGSMVPEMVGYELFDVNEECKSPPWYKTLSEVINKALAKMRTWKELSSPFSDDK